MGKVTIQEIANKLTVQNGLSKKEATLFVNMMFDTIREALERDKTVKVKGLGTFKIIDVDSRESVNVNTGERVLIEGHNKITFTPDVFMKELVNKPFSQFETIVLKDGVDFKDATKEKPVADVPDAEKGDGDMGDMPLVDFASEEDIPEWVIEPYEAPASEKQPEPEPEPVVEQEITVEPEPVAEPEPVVEPEPSVEPEAPVEEDVPTEEGATIDVETPVEEEPDIEEFADLESDEEEPASKRWILWLLGCLLALGIGYLLGNYFPFQSQTESPKSTTPQVQKVVPAKPVAKPVPAEPAPQPAEPVEEPAKEDQKEADVESPKKVVDAAPQVQPEVKAPAKVELDKYEAMDGRVRTGAYRIVGTDFVEKVREGDDLKRISKRTLGPDMECYIEVYNNLKASSELKTGQEIKIPKLELKKKKAAQK